MNILIYMTGNGKTSDTLIHVNNCKYCSLTLERKIKKKLNLVSDARVGKDTVIHYRATLCVL